MNAFKRRPPAFVIRVSYCFLLDFVNIEQAETVEKTLRIAGAGKPVRERVVPF
jgi:hypothetical protein